MTDITDTDYFSVTILGKDGRPFYEIIDIRAEVEVDDECEIVKVLGVFSDYTDPKTRLTSRVYLDEDNPIWVEAEHYALFHSEELLEGYMEREGIYYHRSSTVEEAMMMGEGEWRRTRE